MSFQSTIEFWENYVFLESADPSYSICSQETEIIQVNVQGLLINIWNQLLQWVAIRGDTVGTNSIFCEMLRRQDFKW